MNREGYQSDIIVLYEYYDSATIEIKKGHKEEADVAALGYKRGSQAISIKTQIRRYHSCCYYGYPEKEPHPDSSRSRAGTCKPRAISDYETQKPATKLAITNAKGKQKETAETPLHH